MSEEGDALVEFPPWLQAVEAQFERLRADGRLPHALLIRGPEGWGELELANRLALSLLELVDAPGGQPPRDARTIAHPDLYWVRPEGAMVKVDAIRGLVEFAIGTRQIAPAKVAVIEAADTMNIAASNALLKTLEEPPADTYLLLATTRPARLLSTIVSRCQALRILPDAAAASRWLVDRWPDATRVHAKAFECGQAPLAVHLALTREEPPLEPLLSGLAASGSIAAAVGDLLEYPPDRLTEAWYRHCLAVLSGTSVLPGAAAVAGEGLVRFVDELKAVRYQLLFTNSGNARLLYERLASRWQSLFEAARRDR